MRHIKILNYLMIDIFIRIKSKIYRETAIFFSYRPSSYPYVTGDGFRNFADHIYDDIKKCSVSKIKNGDIVFLKSDLIKVWFENIHPKIKNKYKLITHNSDAVVDENESKYIDDKIIHWFAQNNIFKHEKITPIPIGIENKRLYMSGWTLCKMIKKLKNENLKKINRILFGFSVQTNKKERGLALQSLRNNPLADEIKERTDQSNYYKLLNKYQFVASPEGNGPDCHRTWEALYLGVIPIVTDNLFIKSFQRLDLQMMIIEDWSKIPKLDNVNKSNLRILNFDYWKDLIVNTK